MVGGFSSRRRENECGHSLKESNTADVFFSFRGTRIGELLKQRTGSLFFFFSSVFYTDTHTHAQAHTHTLTGTQTFETLKGLCVDTHTHLRAHSQRPH